MEEPRQSPNTKVPKKSNIKNSSTFIQTFFFLWSTTWQHFAFYPYLQTQTRSVVRICSSMSDIDANWRRNGRVVTLLLLASEWRLTCHREIKWRWLVINFCSSFDLAHDLNRFLRKFNQSPCQSKFRGCRMVQFSALASMSPHTSLSFVTSGIFYNTRFMKPWCHCLCHPSIGCLGDIQHFHDIATTRIHTLDLHCVNLTLFPLIILAPHIFLSFFFCLLVSSTPPPHTHTHTHTFFPPINYIKKLCMTWKFLSWNKIRSGLLKKNCMVKLKIKAAQAYSWKQKG